MRLVFIGAGVMGEAMIASLLQNRIAKHADIWACDVDPLRLTYIREKYSVNCTVDFQGVVGNGDIIILSVKPQTLAQVLEGLKGKVKKEQLILSIAAGIKIEVIRDQLTHDRIIRVMPNTPAQVGQGMSVWTATAEVDEEQKNNVRNVLQTMGKEIYITNEKHIDMATAISGSGPAYIFLIMESLIDAAVHIGLPQEMAEELTVQTVFGAASIARDTGKHPAELKNDVTSPGGTTAEGLLCLEQGGLRGIIAEAVVAAYEKALRLGNGKSK